MTSKELLLLLLTTLAGFGALGYQKNNIMQILLAKK